MTLTYSLNSIQPFTTRDVIDALQEFHMDCAIEINIDKGNGEHTLTLKGERA